MAGAFGLYTHIQSNRRRSVLVIAGLFLLIYVVIFAIFLGFEAMTGRGSLATFFARAEADLKRWWFFATLAVLAWIWFSYNFHQKLIDAVTDGHTIERNEDPRLYNLLENLCISRGVTMPKLKIMESDQLNAFASGMNDKQYAVSVTRGLLGALNDDELEGVLAHELTHIRNGDVRLMVIATIMAGVGSFFGELIYRWLSYGGRISFGNRNSKDDDGKPNQATAALIIAVVLLVVAWVLSLFLKFALSRSREYLADAGAVELTKNPDAMISALLKIEGRAELGGVPSAIMEMCIENEKMGFVDLFATHPPIEARVGALVRNAGGHRPPETVPFLPPTQPEDDLPADDSAPSAQPGPEPAPAPQWMPKPTQAGPWSR